MNKSIQIILLSTLFFGLCTTSCALRAAEFESKEETADPVKFSKMSDSAFLIAKLGSDEFHLGIGTLVASSVAGMTPKDIKNDGPFNTVLTIEQQTGDRVCAFMAAQASSDQLNFIARDSALGGLETYITKSALTVSTTAAASKKNNKLSLSTTLTGIEQLQKLALAVDAKKYTTLGDLLVAHIKNAKQYTSATTAPTELQSPKEK